MPLYFDSDLERVGANKLKPMSRIWGGSSKLRKDECIALITSGLEDPEKVQMAVSRLEPWERNALAIVKSAGGKIPYQTLKVSILASGMHPVRIHGYRDNLIDPLFRRGVILARNSYSPEYFSDSFGSSSFVYSDERLLAHVGQPECLALDIQPSEIGGEPLFRRTSAVALDVLGMLQALQNMGTLILTQKGTVRVSDESKLRKAMHWSDKGIDVDGFLFPNPVHAWLSAFSYSDLIQRTSDDQLILKESPDQFANRPFGEQIHLLLDGFLRTRTWWEVPIKRTYFDNDGKGRSQGRMALIMALTALPLDPEAVYSFPDFEYALYNRIGEDFALDYPPRRPFLFRRDDAEKHEQELLRWQEKTRAAWLEQEYPWLLGAFTTWLYFLGLVELFIDNGNLVGFRLTDTGRATLHPDLATVELTDAHGPGSNDPVWVIQPNFDIIAYLDRISASQLAFLERSSERTESHKHTAHYRLTRDSVYRCLESGTSIDEITTTLQSGAQTDLPQNLRVELQEWASLRERITLRHRVNLVEFGSPQALNTALSQGLAGTIVAERFLLLGADPYSSDWQIIDYANPLPNNLTITETGLIHWKSDFDDLVTASQLDQWAVPKDNHSWLLTQDSVTNALKPGRKISELLNLLNNRLVKKRRTSKYAPPAPSIPPLLELAMLSWAGKKYQVELEQVVVLRCPQEEVFQAIVNSPLLRPQLKGYQYPNLLFIRQESLEALRQNLNWLGWTVSKQLHIIPFDDSTS